MVFINFYFSSSPNEVKPTPSVGTRLEGLLLNEMENSFDPRTNNSATSPTPPPLCKSRTSILFLINIFFVSLI